MSYSQKIYIDMTKLEEIACKYIGNVQNELDVNLGIRHAMKEYAELYAKRCIEALLGGDCVIELNKIQHTNKDNTLRVTTDLPDHD